MKFRNIFWGVILIFAGVLFILQNLGLVYFNWMAMWRLWPVILVLWGVSIIPVKDWIKVVLVLLVLGGSVSFMLNKTVGWDNNKHNTEWLDDEEIDKFFDDDYDEDDRRYTTQTFNIPMEDSSKYVNLKLEAAAGKFTVFEETNNLINFNRKGNSSEYSYFLKSIDSSAVIGIEMENASVNLRKNHANNVNIALNNFPVWAIDLEAGAAAVDFDLKQFKVNVINIEGGAASVKVILGDKYDETHVNINAGASEIVIKIPEESGCNLVLESVFSSKKIKGFEKTDHGKYRTANFDEAVNKIYIDAEAAVSSFTIIRY